MWSPYTEGNGARVLIGPFPGEDEGEQRIIGPRCGSSSGHIRKSHGRSHRVRGRVGGSICGRSCTYDVSRLGCDLRCSGRRSARSDFRHGIGRDSPCGRFRRRDGSSDRRRLSAPWGHPLRPKCRSSALCVGGLTGVDGTAPDGSPVIGAAAMGVSAGAGVGTGHRTWRG